MTSQPIDVYVAFPVFGPFDNVLYFRRTFAQRCQTMAGAVVAAERLNREVCSHDGDGYVGVECFTGKKRVYPRRPSVIAADAAAERAAAERFNENAAVGSVIPF